MRASERGFLLLSSHLGDPQRKCLTVAQFRQLAPRVRDAEPERELRELEARDLLRLGYDLEQARCSVELLRHEALLEHYLRRCERAGCGVLSRVSAGYPQALRSRLGLDGPGSLWFKGDLSILDGPMVALVGSRDILPENAEFARMAGRQAAAQGFTLVSGNARGADQIAQNAALEAGGKVISVLADSLTSHTATDGMLLLSEDGFDMPFSAGRALSRNRVIHALPHLTLVAQCSLRTGGTWDGTVQNLKHGWSKVAGFHDTSESMLLLEQMGAELICAQQLSDLSHLAEPEPNLFAY